MDRCPKEPVTKAQHAKVKMYAARRGKTARFYECKRCAFWHMTTRTQAQYIMSKRVLADAQQGSREFENG